MAKKARYRRAVIIGAGMGGLFTARVLAEHFKEVIVLDRDKPQDEARPRKGVPQGRHAHLLLRSGLKVVEELFPGIVEESVRQGAVEADWAGHLHWFHHGNWKIQYNSKLPVKFQSRPLLERTVRRRLTRYGNVRFRYGMVVERLLGNKEDNRVTGVHVAASGDKPAHDLEADLILDLSGRYSRIFQWMRELGFQTPPEDRLPIDLMYSSRLYRKPKNWEPEWKALAVYPKPPEHRHGLIFPIEDDQWLVSLFGHFGKHPPRDIDGWEKYAADLPHPDFYQAVKRAEPLTNVTTFRFPTQMRRHFHRSRRPPRGLLVMGDALCCFDPVFGQGMSVAAKEARLLKKCLEQSRGLDGLPRTFYRGVKPIVAVPWLLVSSEAMRFPQLRAYRPFYMPVLQWYTQQVFKASGTDAGVYSDFLQLLNLESGPEVLFKPRVIRGVLKAAFKQIPSEPAPAVSLLHSHK
ncbi:MAG: FAD-dependent monooxygenase [Acidobacteriota bacterium]|nr:FAD-dependent monooxygenase [Acidobacteriota bacterium]